MSPLNYEINKGNTVDSKGGDMKYEVEIPDGKYCEGCLLMGQIHEEAYCNLVSEELSYKLIFKTLGGGYIKDDKCPNKKNKSQRVLTLRG